MIKYAMKRTALFFFLCMSYFCLLILGIFVYVTSLKVIFFIFYFQTGDNQCLILRPYQFPSHEIGHLKETLSYEIGLH